MSNAPKPAWGRMPSEVLGIIRKREWDNISKLKKRLLGNEAFPITVSLKVPVGNQVAKDLTHFQSFVDSWRNHSNQEHVVWEERTYRSINKQSVPVQFRLSSYGDLVAFLGGDAAKMSEHWAQVMAPILAVDKRVYSTLIKSLNTLSTLTIADSEMIARVLKQLQPNMGEGLSIRSLPLTGIHTKLIESHISIISDLVDVLYNGQVSDAGDLCSWLGCSEIPNGWLYVRILCEDLRKQFGGFAHMQLSGSDLLQNALPASRIIIIENKDPGYALPDIPDTIAIFGGGGNTAWTKASWLQDRNVLYWGDMDTWGLSFLSQVRVNLPKVKSTMMDCVTYQEFKVFDTNEPKPNLIMPVNLTEPEQALFELLTINQADVRRLEQEFVSGSYIQKVLSQWIESD